jgi:hypothetical protein
MSATTTAVKPKRLRSARGRPRLAEARPRSLPDCGTPELALKRSLGLTAEAVDLARERGLITPEQHWCALHLRWLYAVRYGVPGVTAVDLTRGTGRACHAEEDAHWRLCRERDYHRAWQHLEREGAARVLIRFTVFNEMPLILQRAAVLRSAQEPAQARRMEEEFFRLRAGLDALCALWGKTARRTSFMSS